MADKVASPVAATPASPVAQASPKKASAAAKANVARTKPAHPRTADMVTAAISTLNERGGSSLQAIKKYIVSTYKVDAEKQAPFVKKYLKAAVANGALLQTKGKGASGSFKIASKTDAPKPKVKRAAAKPASPKKKAAASTVAAATKKSPAAKKSPVAKKASATAAATKEKRKVAKSPVAKPAKTAKSPSKAKKAAKSPTSKPKAPKPKKAAAAPKAAKPSPKKAVAAKKK